MVLLPDDFVTRLRVSRLNFRFEKIFFLSSTFENYRAPRGTEYVRQLLFTGNLIKDPADKCTYSGVSSFLQNSLASRGCGVLSLLFSLPFSKSS